MSDAVLLPLFKKLNQLHPLSVTERSAVLGLQPRLEIALPRKVLVREGTTPFECCILLEGYAFRDKMTDTGARQIVSFHIPGDLLDIQHLHLSAADHSVETLTEARIAWVSVGELKRIAEAHPAINVALWRDALIDASIFREWVLNVGRRDAKARIAHMLCEFAVRRAAAGLGDPEGCPIPMTQEQIADATGLTTVHVNRSLRALREDGALNGDGGKFTITSWARLQDLAGFDPAYLHQAA